MLDEGGDAAVAVLGIGRDAAAEPDRAAPDPLHQLLVQQDVKLRLRCTAYCGQL